MVSPVIQTKLYIPRPKSPRVPRPRLIAKLDSLRERKLALVSAPAGFGKTALLSEWIEHQGQQQPPLKVAWLSLDPNDNNPARFHTYFVSALHKLDIVKADDVLPAIHSFQISSLEEIWETLAAQIPSRNCQIALVLDDYHVIEAPLIHESIAFILEQMPPCMHLVISTRADPPLSLSRLRVRGELVDLRVGDLRFSSEEIACFLDQWIGNKLSTADREELEARTEGWIAGLQLAALAMQSLAEIASVDESSLSAFVHRLSGSTRFIMDYLVEEVLQRLPEDQRSFLLQTSILERLSASLCNAVTDREDSQSMLDALEKNNLFLFPLDDERGWYRYHHLFADLLRNTLQRDQPPWLPELHSKASAWYESQNLITEAIQHALKIPDPERAVHLMENAGLDLLLRGEAATVQSWSTWIAEEDARLKPLLCVYFAWAFLLSDNVELAEHYLSSLDPDKADLSPSAPDLQGHITAAYAMLHFLKSDYENTIRYSNQALERLSPELSYLRSVLFYGSGAASVMIGEDEAGFQAYQEALRMGRAFGNRTSELFAFKRLGDLYKRRGELHQSVLAYRHALQVGGIREGQFLPVVSAAISALGQLYYEWNRLEEAEGCLTKSIELSRKLGNKYVLQMSLMYLALIRWSQGERDGALRLYREAEQSIMDFPPHPSVAAQVALQQVHTCLHLGETQAAVRWAQLQDQDWRSGHAQAVEWMSIAWARLWISQGEALQAIENLEQALAPARRAGRWGVVIELLVLQSIALASCRQVPQAVAALEEALRLAEPEGYTRIFLDEGEPMIRLLRMVYRSKEKGSRDYETMLLEELLPTEAPAASISPDIPSHSSRDRPVLIEPLTERELEVLRMIVEGCSNQEIAEKLVITLGTVKAHVSNIYGKLDVRSRTQAIIKADQLGLINTGG